MNDHCLDCGVVVTRDVGPGEYYMVKDDVWLQTGLGKSDGQLCIECIGTRIGRDLAPDDLIPWPINFPSLDLDTPRLYRLKCDFVRGLGPDDRAALNQRMETVGW